MKKRVLAIGAHPDDIEIGCGGTLCLLHDQGYEIVHLIVTSGEEGSTHIPKDQLIQLRKSEAQLSAEVLGAKKVIFLDAPDGLTSFSKDLKIQMISYLRELQPEIVFTHAKADNFPDHAVVHNLTMASIVASAGPWYPAAGLSPHQIQKVFGYEVWNPISNFQLANDISSVMERKMKALSQHKSQTGDVDYLAAVKGLAKYRAVMSMTGAYAEVFEVLRISSPL